MKSDQEFLEGIYIKARLLQQMPSEVREEKNTTTEIKRKNCKQNIFGKIRLIKRHPMEFIAMVAVIVILVLLPGTEAKHSMEQMELQQQHIPQQTSLDTINQRSIQVDYVEEAGVLCGTVQSETETYYLVKQEHTDLKDEYKILYWYGNQEKESDKYSTQTKVLYTYVNQLMTLDEEQNTWLKQQFTEILDFDTKRESIAIYPLEKIDER
ncbi:hypothetical protein [Anaerosporobacter faecicola]|uniref:hypothetical protein n=1 Tax=Anaerosporobacter faecicola TaxID=2718714 RepID=UPI00143BFA8E|nr:hypothetical protein [Anaerosporobacter faecicola]